MFLYRNFCSKAKSGEFQLAVINLLDQKIGISQSANLTFLNARSSTLLAVSYAFIYLRIKQAAEPEGARPGGGMIRIMRQVIKQAEH